MPPSTPPLLGISLQADEHFLALNRELIEASADIYEINPETLWDREARPNPLYPVLRDIVERSHRPTLGHGTLYSLGAATPPPRQSTWLQALRRDQEAFAFLWYSEPLGFADQGGRHLALPLPLPPDDDTVTAVAHNLKPLAEIFGTVAFENNVGYFALGDPLAEPDLFRDLCDRTGGGMVLDLHSAYTSCVNFGVDLGEWLERIPWASVLEIHLSGGSFTDKEWFTASKTFRLDSHDRPVPEPVWEAFAAVLPRCSNLRAVIVERLPDGMDKAAARQFAKDLEHARKILC
ncbi:MAG: multinuclear nonheme iron-dependent oxidase [Planctomycetota bacterium]